MRWVRLDDEGEILLAMFKGVIRARQRFGAQSVEVVPTILGVARRDVGQRTPKPVDDKHKYF